MLPTRVTDLSGVFFAVEEKPIFQISSNLKQKVLFNEKQVKKEYQRIPHFKAIVDTERGHVFSVVAGNYRLVSNEDAVELGKKCFCTVFNQANAKKMKVFNIITPKTRSFCHIDFIHEEGGFEPLKDDSWIPFLRITNSYNRTKPLRFDLGFCRRICINGMIFGERTISFRYFHTRGEIANTVEFHKSFDQLKALEKKFTENVHNLKRYYIPKEVMFPLLCRVFTIKFRKVDLERPRRREQLLGFHDHVNALTDKYFNEIGSNGYAALNVITDFASRPKFFISPNTMVDALQKRIGDWIESFLTTIQDKKFHFDDYLGEYLVQSDILNGTKA